MLLIGLAVLLILPGAAPGLTEEDGAAYLNEDNSIKIEALIKQIFAKPENAEDLTCSVTHVALVQASKSDEDMPAYARAMSRGLIHSILAAGAGRGLDSGELKNLALVAGRGASCGSVLAASSLLMGTEGLSSLVRETSGGLLAGVEDFLIKAGNEVDSDEINQAAIAGVKEGVSKCGLNTGQDLAVIQLAADDGINDAIGERKDKVVVEKADTRDSVYTEQGIDTRPGEDYRRERQTSPSQ
ncbi:hypothetical protein HNR65_001782 [Desulfosalsimonas propionicica]|uniref:Uncharacterized protein n=1 Tax=Desulfosalsimonas propionicica TaxID=332175 RepID=A0A7W0C9A3_9BACT|nr:hypothetical protein [Desulfosalsimonas propionicica]MBA2881455.1 hypothetical protein [Desulfosalsimonas propionicica]